MDPKGLDWLEFGSQVRITARNLLTLNTQVKGFLVILGYGGSILNKFNNGGDTALLVATLEKKLEAMKLLVEFGADVNLASTDDTKKYT